MLKTPTESFLFTWLIIGLIASWGGGVRYLIAIEIKSLHWSWGGVLSQLSISIFTGVLGGLLSIESGASSYMTFVIAGLFGSLGSTILNFLYQHIFRLSGVKL